MFTENLWRAPLILILSFVATSCGQQSKTPDATQAKPKSEDLRQAVSISPEKDKERADYLAELDKLKREDPAKYEQQKKALTLGLQMFLGKAGYGIGPFDGIMDTRTENALRQYQKDNGLSVNGDVLDMDVLDKITQQERDLRAPARLPPKLPLPTSGFSLWDDGFVQATGTWVSLNQKIGIPLQTSQITCIRSQKQCIESRAELHDYGFGFGDTLNVSTEFYDIERWDTSEIVTKPSDKLCVRSVTRINRLQKSASAIDSKISDQDPCKDVANKDINSELQDGTSVYLNLQHEYLETRKRIFKLTPDALRLLNSDGDKK